MKLKKYSRCLKICSFSSRGEEKSKFFLFLFICSFFTKQMATHNLSSVQGNGNSQCSAFYLACRNGDKAMFDKLVKSLDKDAISKLDPYVQSTPLHAAVYYGHAAIARELLSRGADRTIRNCHGNLAEDEARTEELQRLFQRYTKY